LFLKSECDSVVSAVIIPSRPALPGFDFRNAVEKRLLRLVLPDGRLVAPGKAGSALSPGTLNKARACRLNGAIYVLGRRVFSGKLPIENKNTLAYLMPASRSVDIDELRDLQTAAALLTAAPR
jgi:CMP-N-acetylneuraminic acid synthetase